MHGRIDAIAGDAIHQRCHQTVASLFVWLAWLVVALLYHNLSNCFDILTALLLEGALFCIFGYIYFVFLGTILYIHKPWRLCLCGYKRG